MAATAPSAEELFELLLEHLKTTTPKPPSLEEIAAQIAVEVEEMSQADYSAKRAKGWDPAVEASERFAAALEKSNVRYRRTTRAAD